MYSAAVTVAWYLGSLISPSEALVASIMAVITLRTSVHASLNEAFNQVVGTSVGVIVGILSIILLKNEIASVIITAITALTISKVLTLGEYGVVNILITALIVVGPGQPVENASNRAIGTVIGVLIALTLSYWTLPTTPASRTLTMVNATYKDIADMYAKVSDSLTQSKAKNSCEIFLVNSRALVASIEKTRTQAEEAVHYAEWNPTTSKSATKNVYHEFVALEHCYIHTRTVARTLFDSAENTREDILEIYSSLLKSLSVMLKSKSEPDVYTMNSLVLDIKSELENLYNKVREEQYKQNVSTMTFINSIERILESVTGKSEAITEVNTPILTKNSWTSFLNYRKTLRFKG